VKFRKKPVVIEAVQWTGHNVAEVAVFCGNDFLGGDHQGALYIGTLEDGAHGEAKHVASIGDWIIRGVKGEHYPCKPDIFEQTYEAVKE